MIEIKTYFDHILTRKVVGPVIIVFSLQGVIIGLFSMHMPQAWETAAWGVIFLMSIASIAHWGTTGEAEEKLESRIEGL